jgi:hypothetical protein
MDDSAVSIIQFHGIQSQGFAQCCLPFIPTLTNINALFAEKFISKAGPMPTL